MKSDIYDAGMRKIPCGLYVFKGFDEKQKKANGIRANHRLDCVYYLHKCDTPAFTKKGEHPLYPYENRKRQLFLYQQPLQKVLNKRTNRMAEYCLIGNSLNLSSLYTEYEDKSKQWAYGFPHKRDMYSLFQQKQFSPLYDYTNDGYIFKGTYGDDKLNRKFNYLELYVFPEARDEIESIYNLAIDGEYDDLFEYYKEIAYPYPYYSYNETMSVNATKTLNDEDIQS